MGCDRLRPLDARVRLDVRVSAVCRPSKFRKKGDFLLVVGDKKKKNRRRKAPNSLTNGL